MMKFLRRTWPGFLVSIWLVLLTGSVEGEPSEIESNFQQWLPAYVKKVIDGDTIEVIVEGKTARVRLLRVNTPESVHPNRSKNVPFGKVASQYARKRLEGKSVFLEFEGKRCDHYGRLLAYVWVDSELFNLALIQDCMSPYYRKYGVGRYEPMFSAAEEHAKEKNCGVWKDTDDVLGNE